MIRISFTVEAASDGGLVVYSDNGGTTDMNLVFAGNQKETTDYLAKRVGELKAEKPVAGGLTVLDEDARERWLSSDVGEEIKTKIRVAKAVY